MFMSPGLKLRSSQIRQPGSLTHWSKYNSRIPRPLYLKQPCHRSRRRKGLDKIYLHLSWRYRPKSSSCILRGLRLCQFLTRPREKEAPSTTVIKVDRPPFSSSLHKVITSAVLEKSIDSPLTTQQGKVGPKLSIFEKYELIKKRNQTLTNNTSAQFWKQTSTAQHRLLSTFDIEKGRMHMEFL
jgi:hypothetical protein